MYIYGTGLQPHPPVMVMVPRPCGNAWGSLRAPGRRPGPYLHIHIYIHTYIYTYRYYLYEKIQAALLYQCCS